MTRINAHLEDRQTAILDRIAAEEGVSRAEVIRRLIDRGLAGREDDLTAGLAAIDESSGVLEDVEPPVRAVGGREEHLARWWRIAA